MAGITLGAIGDVIVANDVAALKQRIAFAAIVDRIGAGADDTMHPPCSTIETIVNNAAVKLRSVSPGRRSAKRVEIGRVEEIGRFLEQCNFLRRLDPAHLVHHFGAIDELQLREPPRTSSQCAALT